jgi:hypothetical protein
MVIASPPLLSGLPVRCLLVAFGGLILAGCAIQRPPPVPSLPPVVAEAPTAPVHEPPPIPKKKPVPSAASEQPRPPPSQTAAIDLPPPPPPQPIEVLGLDPAGVRALLGEPGTQDDSPPAIMWRYTAGSCGLRIYFYQDFQSRELRALFLDVDGDDQSNQRKQSCLHSIRHGGAIDAASTASAR